MLLVLRKNLFMSTITLSCNSLPVAHLNRFIFPPYSTFPNLKMKHINIPSTTPAVDPDPRQLSTRTPYTAEFLAIPQVAPLVVPEQ